MSGMVEHVHEWVFVSGSVAGVEWVPVYGCYCGAEAIDAHPESDHSRLVETDREPGGSR